MAPSSPFAETLQAVAVERRGTSHPGLERLLGYHENRLGHEEREDLQEHLAVCPSCARTALDIANFFDVEGTKDENRLADMSLTDELTATYQRLGVAVMHGRRARFHKFALTLAAVLAVALIGLGAIVGRLGSRLQEQGHQILRLEEELTQSPGSGHSFEVVSLRPLREELRSAAPPIAAALANDEGPVPVILNFYTREGATYRAELLNASGDVLKSWSPLRPTSKKNLTFFLSSTLRQRGSYAILLYSLDSGESSLEAKFQLEVTG